MRKIDLSRIAVQEIVSPSGVATGDFLVRYAATLDEVAIAMQVAGKPWLGWDAVEIAPQTWRLTPGSTEVALQAIGKLTPDQRREVIKNFCSACMRTEKEGCDCLHFDCPE